MDDAYKKARKRVKQKKKLLKELSVFFPFAIGMTVLNLTTAPNNLWFLWAIGPWGLTLFARSLSFAIGSKSEDWEEREMRKELRSMGKDPDDYIEERLELEELEPEYASRNGRYRDDEFV